MKFIPSKIRWIGMLTLVGFAAAAAGLYFDPGSPAKKAGKTSEKTSPVVAAPSAGDHSRCNHGHSEDAKDESDCAAAAAEKADLCCRAKPADAKVVLPAGHPPVDGCIAEESHAGCSHDASGTAATKANQP